MAAVAGTAVQALQPSIAGGAGWSGAGDCSQGVARG